ncbi:inositol monophosphatase family protein [Microbacterium sp. cf046]|uniref:inositol monophosphatase family protein n=1 Tax=Microbacterium sp. cf046 TaxID=1761803 RepID=UPI0020C93697|nr:inositol monophosphatase family protein [Microbacterium sp. cf046]
MSDAEVAVRAALAGAAVVRSRYGSGSRRVSETGVDFTTDADVEAERAIRAVLSTLRPGDAVLGEELGASGDSTRIWLVDPICGTMNFAAGLPVFAVNVALEVDGATRVGAVADPVAGHTFWADGTDAWRRVDGVDSLLTPSSWSRLVTVNLESAYSNGVGARLLVDERVRSRFSPRCLSSTLALAWVATGQQAAYVTGGDLRGSVHWAAGIALCEAADAVVTNLAGGELHTGDHGLLAAADAETHAFLLEAIR